MKKKTLVLCLLTGLFLYSCNRNSERKSKSVQAGISRNEELLIGSWVEPNPINRKEVQGIEIKAGGSAKSINMSTLVYSKWWTRKNQLFVVEKSIGNHSFSIDTMAYDIIKIDMDSLIISDKHATIRYKRQ